MKKFVLSAIFALAAGLPAMSQLSFGFRGGVNCVSNNISSINCEKVMSSDSYTGFYAGPTLEVGMLGFGLEAAAIYSERGMELAVDETLKQKSLDIPVTVKKYFGDGGALDPFVEAGAQFSYRIGHDGKMYVSRNDDNSNLYQVSSFNLNESFWSINIGAGVKLFQHVQLLLNFNMPVTHQGVYAFYDELEQAQAMSLADQVSQAESIVARGEEKFKSSTMQVSLTYTF